MEPKDFDDLLGSIGLGRYHYYLFACLGLNYFSFGTEFVMFAIMPEVLAGEWDLSSVQIGVMGGMIFVGLLIGTFISAFGDRFGRLLFLRLSTALIVLGGALSPCMPEYYSYLLFRTISGIGFGIFEPT